ncbi:polysaccharide biosynthesis protein, partial [Thermodesulfobacteriota bacterium]
MLRERLLAFVNRGELDQDKDVVVIGAGDAGELLIREINRNPFSGMAVRALFDDDKSKRRSYIHGVRVSGTVEEAPSYVQENDIHTVIIAIPSADKTEMKRIFALLKDLRVSVKTLPALHELMEGTSKLTQLRDIQISDLLGREEIHIDTEQVQNMINGKVVAVTGAGGSIGSELSRQILRRKPSRLLLIDSSENSLYHIHAELTKRAAKDKVVEVVPILCDVRDQERIYHEFEEHRPSLVFHAAAHKHVPMQELNPVQCFKNNVGGLQTLAVAADKFQVERFLLISTDKAVNPTSVMGATKRACELYCSAFGSISETKFLSVRFGNVLASQGSVVPLFLDQISKGGPVTVTHPEMRRYFMTIPEAVTLVLQATALGESGQIMVLEMGEAIKIVDLARQLVQLVGKGTEDIAIEFVGLRPGEKLFEEISGENETCLETAHRKIKIYRDNGKQHIDVIEKITELTARAIHTNDQSEIRRMLQQIVPEYRPYPSTDANESDNNSAELIVKEGQYGLKSMNQVEIAGNHGTDCSSDVAVCLAKD